MAKPTGHLTYRDVLIAFLSDRIDDIEAARCKGLVSVEAVRRAIEHLRTDDKPRLAHILDDWAAKNLSNHSHILPGELRYFVAHKDRNSCWIRFNVGDLGWEVGERVPVFCTRRGDMYCVEGKGLTAKREADLARPKKKRKRNLAEYNPALVKAAS